MISQFAEHLRAATFKHASRDHFSWKLSLSQLTSFARNLICLGVSNFRKMKRSYRWLELIQLLIIFLCCFICNNINYLKLQVTTEKSSTKVDIITLFTTLFINYLIYERVNRTLEIPDISWKRLKPSVLFRKMQYWLRLMWRVCTRVFPIKLA